MKLNEKHFNFDKNHSIGDSQGCNVIIHGENISSLKNLKSNFKEKVKCIYIDPPYNNGEKYFHYEDSQESKKWLSEMRNTLKSLKPFLTEDGSIWISIDDNELHYLKVEADKVFGRKNFVSTIIWQQRTTRENRTVFSNNHEYLLVYAKDFDKFKKSRNLDKFNEEVYSRYKNPDNDSRGPWQSVSANVQDGHAAPSQFYTIVAPNGKKHNPPKGRCWCYNEKRMIKEIEENNIWFGKDGNGVPRIKKFLKNKTGGLTPETFWPASIAGTNKSAKKHLLKLLPENELFETPKPEELIKRVFEIATNEGDLVMDCYLGSGTTVTTAHKMGREYIGIERGDQIVSWVVERLRLVVEGEQGGVSKDLNWKGGGGFRFYHHLP